MNEDVFEDKKIGGKKWIIVGFLREYYFLVFMEILVYRIVVYRITWQCDMREAILRMYKVNVKIRW